MQQFVQEWFDEQLEQINFAQVLCRSGIFIFRFRHCYCYQKRMVSEKVDG